MNVVNIVEDLEAEVVEAMMEEEYYEFPVAPAAVAVGIDPFHFLDLVLVPALDVVEHLNAIVDGDYAAAATALGPALGVHA